MPRRTARSSPSTSRRRRASCAAHAHPHDDAERLTQGRPALADSEPSSPAPARSRSPSPSVGFVARAAHGAGLAAPLPAFAVDRLQDEFSHGDLLIAADDPLTVAHARACW
jgi:dye decolorizing peroxidase